MSSIYTFAGTGSSPPMPENPDGPGDYARVVGLANTYPRLELRASSCPPAAPCSVCGVPVVRTGLDWYLEGTLDELACGACADKYAPAVLHERREHLARGGRP